MMKISLLALALLCFFSSRTSAQTYLFVGSYFPSILQETADGEYQGVGAEIAKEIVEGLGHSIEIKLYPWARAQQMIKNGQAAAIIGPYKTAQRIKFMDYTSNHFYTDRIVFYTKSDSSLSWNGDFLKLKGVVIGTTRGWSYGTRFDQIKYTLTLEPVKDLCTNFKKLMIGRVDIVPATQRNALVCIEELNIADKVKLLPPDIQTIKGYYGFSKRKELSHFKALFDEKLQLMINNGTVSSLNDKYQLRY